MAFDGPTIRVQRVVRERTLFQLMPDKVTLSEVGAPAKRPPDVVVLPSRKGYLDFAGPEYDLPPEIVARLVSGQAALAFDCSGEGIVHTLERTIALHSYIERIGVSPQHCVYITQDRKYSAAYLAQCQAMGWREPVRVLNYDYFIKALFRDLHNVGEEIFERRLRTHRERRHSRNKRYICLNFTPRPHKVFFLLQLIEDDLWRQGFVSFGGFGIRGDRSVGLRKMMKMFMRDEGWGDLPSRLGHLIPELDERGQVLFGEMSRMKDGSDRIKSPSHDAEMPEQHESWFTIATETEMSGPLRVTEKSFKPLVNFHPVIVLGNPGALELIREFGFRTFPNYFDESYDAELEPTARFARVAAEVRRLCRLDEHELKRLEEEIDETLVHNARWGLTKLPAVYRDTIDKALLEDIGRALAPDLVTI